MRKSILKLTKSEILIQIRLQAFLSQHTDRSSVSPSVTETSSYNTRLFSVDNAQCPQWIKKQDWHACGRDNLLLLPSRPGKNTFLFYTHRRGPGKRITAWDCITLSQNPLQRKKTSLAVESKAFAPQESSCSHTSWKGKFPRMTEPVQKLQKKPKDAILPVELSVGPWSEKKFPCYNQPPG